MPLTVAEMQAIVGETVPVETTAPVETLRE